MTTSQAVILGLIQGLTEFLPVSSSGHLVIVETLFGLNVEKMVVFDVIVHVGTLLALLCYFRRDIFDLAMSFARFLGRKNIRAEDHKNRREIFYLVIATIPAVIAAVLFQDVLMNQFRSVGYVGMWMIIVGIIYLLAEKFGRKKLSFLSSGRQALVIGLFQAVALLPGVSRSGSTIVGGLMSGLKRQEAARFSFLLGIIAIFGAFVFTLPDLRGLNEFGLSFPLLAAGFLSSFGAGYFSISFLMRYLVKHSLRIFSVYLILLGLFLVFFLDLTPQVKLSLGP